MEAALEVVLREVISQARCILWDARVLDRGASFDWEMRFYSSDHLRREFGLIPRANETEAQMWNRLISAPPGQIERMDGVSHGALREGAPGFEQEFWIYSHDGSRRWLREFVKISTVSPMEWQLVGVAVDITERKQFEEKLAAANVQLQELASYDALTGVFNRRLILERAEAEWARWLRYAKPFSVLLVDVDDFKAINDQHGHLAGDQVLRLLGKRLTQAVRSVDSVGRYGGEEFLMLLPETTLEGAEAAAKKLLQQVRTAPFATDKNHLTVTLSCGVAAALPADKDLDGLLHRVDEALYKAKGGGKNRYVVAT